MELRFLKLSMTLLALGIINGALSSTGNITDVFDSFPKIVEYSKLIPEYPKPDNSDWENPDFSTYHAHMISGKLYKNLKSGALKSLWSAKGFKSLLEHIIDIREFNGYKGRFVMKMYPIPGTRMIIFGEMHGAFHSLVRDLEALKRLGYIDDSLKIVKPDCYILFNGNISSRSPYILETMTVILRLMYVNPDKVILMRGSQEDKERWTNYSLRNEFRIRAADVGSSNAELASMANNFFDTLPLAMYLVASQTSKSVDLVRISSYGTESKDLTVKDFADFFVHPESLTGMIEEGLRRKSEVDVNIMVLIRGEQFYKSQYLPSTGLQLSGREEGAISWVVMSSPTQAYQVLFQFFYDAFALLTTRQSLEDWTFSLFNRDVRGYEQIKQTKVFKLVSGMELTSEQAVKTESESLEERVAFLKGKISSLDESLKTGRIVQLTQELAFLKPETKSSLKEFTEEPQGIHEEAKQVKVIQHEVTGIPMGNDPAYITVGTLVDLSDGTKEEGESIVQGIRAVFDRVNEQGGIRGKKLKLEVKDTRYLKEYARIGVEKLLTQDNTGIVLSPLSTVVLEGLLDLVQKKSVLALFPMASGATNVRRQDLSNMFFIRASTIQEGYTITKYVVEDFKAKRIAFFYENDTFGLDTLKGARQALNELGVKDSLAISYEPSDLNIVDQVATLKKSNVDALGCFGMQAVVKELYNQLGTKWLVNKKLFGSMDLSMLSFRKYCERNRFQFVSTSVVPNPEKSEIDIVKEYRYAIENTPPSNDIHCLEAYIGADFFVHVLKEIGEPITSERIIKYLENIKNYTYKGLVFSFNPVTRQLMHVLWLNKGSEDWESFSTLAFETETGKQAQEIKSDIGPKQVKVYTTSEIQPEVILRPSHKIEKVDKILDNVESSTLVSKTVIEQSKSIAKDKEMPVALKPKKAEGKSLVIGSSMDFSRGAKDLSLAVKSGIEMALDEEHIPDLHIRFVPLDDSYMPSKARENVLKLIEKYSVDFLLCPVGSSTFVAYIDLVKTGTPAILFPIPGIAYDRTGTNSMKYCIYFRPSYLDESFVLMRYIMNKKNPKEVAIFYQDDEFGINCLKGARKAIVASSVKIIELAYARNDVNFDTQVKTIQTTDVKFVGIFATPLAARRLLEQLGDEAARRCTFFGVSDLGGLTFKKMVMTKGISIIRSNVVPDPVSSSIRLVQDYRESAQKSGIAIESFSLEGYISAMIIIDVLRRVKGDITKDTVVRELENLKNYSLQGLSLNFDEQKRQLSNTIWIEDGKGPWIDYAVPERQ